MILGSETPRIFTPPLRKLTPETTHGFAAIAFAEDVLGVSLFPWQKWALIHALELRPLTKDELAAGAEPSYRFRFCVITVARQAGKTMIMLILALWHIYALDSPTVIATAQDLANAEKAWGEAGPEKDAVAMSLMEYLTFGTGGSKLADVLRGLAPSEDVRMPTFLTAIKGMEFQIAKENYKAPPGKEWKETNGAAGLERGWREWIGKGSPIAVK